MTITSTERIPSRAHLIDLSIISFGLAAELINLAVEVYASLNAPVVSSTFRWPLHTIHCSTRELSCTNEERNTLDLVCESLDLFDMNTQLCLEDLKCWFRQLYGGRTEMTVRVAGAAISSRQLYGGRTEMTVRVVGAAISSRRCYSRSTKTNLRASNNKLQAQNCEGDPVKARITHLRDKRYGEETKHE
ncbi:hypothetical protein J6590_013170 [Homalodisca vitripennis]|nr:hypothetical protein J6590_013170 [Homalodisca vitripennis]